MIQLFNYPNSRSLRVTWMLEELEEDYEFTLVPLGSNEAAYKEYLKINRQEKSRQSVTETWS